jgi:hypothetical protein
MQPKTEAESREQLRVEVARMLEGFRVLLPRAPEEITTQMVRLWVDVLSSARATAEEVKTVAEMVLRTERYWPAPAAFIERLNERRESEARTNSEPYEPKLTDEQRKRNIAKTDALCDRLKAQGITFPPDETSEAFLALAPYQQLMVTRILTPWERERQQEIADGKADQ